MRYSGLRRSLMRAWLLWALPLAVSAQESPLTYQVPSQVLADLADAPLTPGASISPDQQWMLLLERSALSTIRDLAEPELRLAGIRFNPANNGPSRTYHYTGLSLMRLADGSARRIAGLPAEPRIMGLRWAPDSSRAAFLMVGSEAVELWTVTTAGQAARWGSVRLNGVFGTPFHWLPDSSGVIALTVPAGRGQPPPEPKVPTAPVIQENLGRTAPVRTYQDLLENPYHEALFEYYARSQPVRLGADGSAAALGQPAIYWSLEPSPDGNWLLADILHGPFSYLVPYYRFPVRTEVRDRDGRPVYEVAELPLAEEIPVDFDAVRQGRRIAAWRADADAALYFVEAQDRGDPKVEAAVRDRVYTLAAPFRSEPRLLADLGLRFSTVQWSEHGLALIRESWWKNRRTRTWVVQPDTAGSEPRKLFDRSSEDRYSDPGSPVVERNSAGRLVLVSPDEGKTLFLTGEGYSPEGNRPFLDKLDVASGRSERLWRAEGKVYERPLTLLGSSGATLLTSRETPDEPPQYYTRNVASGELRKLTDFPHPSPQLIGVRKELIQYERADGVKLSGTLYLPPGYTADQGPLPLVMWAYPREYKSASAAGQVSDSPHRFVRVSAHSPLFFLALGYAVLDDPAMPIVGEGNQEPNDSYVRQLVASAEAAVNEAVRRGVAERGRIAIGGHSYGAFMTANLLAHSDLFAAGIARSGAYNRTLTPFGFQAEERTFWQAPEIYFAMSPFMHADKIKEPILLIHGEADNNAGTFPIQSERFYHALKGHGATVRYVVLPLESHGYQARESVLHMLWETEQWLGKYVRNARPAGQAPSGE